MNGFSRRTFLATAAGAGLAAPLLARSASADPLGKPAGIQLYTVGAELKADTIGTLKKIHDIGYREVETAGFGTLSAKDFRKALDTIGLTCVSCHLALGMDTDPAPLFDDAHTVGARYAVSSTLLGPDPAMRGALTKNSFTLDDFKRMADRANQVAQAVSRAGLQYAYHNHNFEFKTFDGKPGYDTLLANTDKTKVMFEIDCGWMVLGGFSPADYMAKYPGRFRMLHVKDFKKDTPHPSTVTSGHIGTELGTGFIDYGPIFAAGKKAGVEHCFVEQEPPFTDMAAIDAAKADYDYLHKFS